MIVCGFCGQADRSRRPADVIGILCSGCVQRLLNMPVERKLALWREAQETTDPRIKWLEQFIPEEVLRDERFKAESPGFHQRGEVTPGLWSQEGDLDPAASGEGITLHQPGVEQGLFNPGPG
jgi:hypothetical protein